MQTKLQKCQNLPRRWRGVEIFSYQAALETLVGLVSGASDRKVSREEGSHVHDLTHLDVALGDNIMWRAKQTSPALLL